MLPSWYRKMEARVFNMIARALIRKTKEGVIQLSSMSTTDEDDYRDVERVQNYGFTSVPGPDADGLVVFLTGSTELPLIISADHPEERKQVEEWEAALYTKFGSHVYLKKDGSIDILSKAKMDMKATEASLDFGSAFKVKAAETSIESPKFAVKSQNDELVKVLVEILAQIDEINTAITPDTGMPAAAKGKIKAALALLKPRLEAFKV